MTIGKLLQLQRNFDEQHAGNSEFYVDISDANARELEHVLVCLFGEIGELANLAKKAVRGDFALSERKAEIASEIADIFAYTLKLSNQLGIDLEQEYLKKMESNKGRFRRFEK